MRPCYVRKVPRLCATCCQVIRRSGETPLAFPGAVALARRRLATAECVAPRPRCETLARSDIVGLVDVVEAAEPGERNFGALLIR